jgi:hypothetical protein
MGAGSIIVLESNLDNAPLARVAELADAQDSGSCPGYWVEVQVLSRALLLRWRFGVNEHACLCGPSATNPLPGGQRPAPTTRASNSIG